MWARPHSTCTYVHSGIEGEKDKTYKYKTSGFFQQHLICHFKSVQVLLEEPDYSIGIYCVKRGPVLILMIMPNTLLMINQTFLYIFIFGFDILDLLLALLKTRKIRRILSNIYSGYQY
jgi:hypothetical protein